MSFRELEWYDSDFEDFIASYIATADDDDDDDDDDGGGGGGGSDDDEVCSEQFGAINLSVIKGDIVNQEADVIVNVTSKTLDLQQGVVSRAIVASGGDSIQEELNNDYPNGIQDQELAISDGGSLPCEQIYHTSMPKKRRSHNCEKMIGRTMSECLKQAQSDGHSSIALPALGTGRLGYDKKRAASAMFESVRRFSEQQSADSSVDKVYIVLYPSDTDVIQAFKTTSQRDDTDTPNGTVCTKDGGRLQIKLCVDSLINQKTDVVVGSGRRGLDLSRGQLSKSILEAAGPGIQAECKQKYPKGIEYGKIAKLDGGNMRCKHVYMGALPDFKKQSERYTHQECLTRLVKSCLEQASRDGMTSISFPPLGTGYVGYPPGMAANFLATAIEEFASNQPSSSITLVKIVIHRTSVSKCLRAYEMELEKENIASGGRPTPQPRRSLAIPDRNTVDFCVHMYQEQLKPPSYWTKFTANQALKTWIVNLKGQSTFEMVDVDSDTFKVVDRLVQQTWEPSKVGHGRDAKGIAQLSCKGLKVKKVQRVENLSILEPYGNRRQELFHDASEDSLFDNLSELPGLKHGKSSIERHLSEAWRSRLYGEVNEGYFFHGTKADKVAAVCSQGLDPRMAQGEAVFGPAIYMAESSTKADQYTDSRGDNRQKQDLQMFLVRATLGEICLKTKCHKMRRPPCQETSCASDTCQHEKRYHSIVEESKFIFREFVVYDRAQVYPEYVITYDRVCQ